MIDRSLQFRAQRQKNAEWCWAAVSNSIEHFFEPTSPLTQCEIAGEQLRKPCCGDLTEACLARCNVPSALDTALRRLGWLARSPVVHFPPDPAVDFADVRAEIDAGRPLCLLVKWLEEDGELIRGHFITIKGYRVTTGGTAYVSIQDPLFADPEIQFEVLADRSGGYRDGQGVWVATFFVRSTRRRRSRGR